MEHDARIDMLNGYCNTPESVCKSYVRLFDEKELEDTKKGVIDLFIKKVEADRTILSDGSNLASCEKDIIADIFNGRVYPGDFW